MLESRSLTCLTVFALLLTGLAAVEPANGANILVLANSAWTGPDGSEIGESERVARYYMQKRKVPEQNLLIVDLVASDCNYAHFHQQVITQVAAKLTELRAGAPVDPILYIVCCYGVPTTIYLPVANKTWFEPREPKDRIFNDDGSLRLSSRHRFAIPRAADSFLSYPHLLTKLPADEVPDAGIYGFGGVFDKYGFAPPVVHPYYGLAVKPGETPNPEPLSIGYALSKQTERALSFAEVRAKDPKQFAYYLVCRIDAPNPVAARSLVDKAIYAETYLQHPAVEKTTKTECVFDLGEFASTNAQIQDAINWFAGKTAGSPFAMTPWPMIVDTGTTLGEEIGVADAKGIPYPPNDPHFAGRAFPITNSLFYYGQYTTYGRYQDVYQWAVGSVGVHMDSGSCSNLHARNFDAFATNPEPGDELRVGFVPHALVRNLTAAAGVVHEPYENGIAAANFLYRSLSLGMPFADACYSATRDIWWKSIFIGDPLYRPFGLPKRLDDQAPVILDHRLVPGGEADRRTLIMTTDKPCQFQVASGGKILRPYTTWGATWAERDWFYACECTVTLPTTAIGAEGVTISVRSPAGLEARMAVALDAP